MGDRANILIVSNGGADRVHLYSHWGGSELGDILKAAMIRGRPRWNDAAYLTRIIFCEMVKDDVLGETGFGISRLCGDGDDRIYVVDVDKQTVLAPTRKRAVSFEKYVHEK